MEYLETSWTQREVKNFSRLVQKKLDNIAKLPQLGSLTGKRNNVRKVVLQKRVILFYKHKPLKGEIELLLFWDTRQNPRRLKW